MRKHIKYGKIAVLVSHGFGAGWSTWHDIPPDDEECAHIFDTEGADALESYCKVAYPDAYLGGIEGLVIYWLDPGTRYRIEEYDGSESLKIFNEGDYLIA